MRVSVLGLGRMGEAITQRLLDHGFDVVVWNRTPGKAEALVSGGAVEAADIAGACLGADVVLTSLADDEAVREVALGEGGVRRHAGAAVYVETSTISPALSAELAGAIDSFAAVPVLGGPQAVRQGQATYLVGAPDAVYERIAPVLDALSPNCRRYAAAAVASAAKVTVNAILLVGVVTLAEAFAVGRAGGLTDQQLRELLSESPIVAPGLRNRFEALLEGTDDGWWTIALGAKDARLAMELAQADEREIPVVRAARARFEAAATAGFAENDIAMVATLYRDR